MENGRHSRRIRTALPEGIPDERIALAIEKEMRAVVRSRAAQTNAPIASTVVSDLWDDYLSWYRIRRSPNTYRDLQRCYSAHIGRILGKYRVQDLGPSHISLYQKIRHAEYARTRVSAGGKRPVSNRTINKELQYFSGFMTWCRKEKKVTGNVTDISPLPYNSPVPIVLSPDEIYRIINAAGPFYRALILCLYALGLRIAEATHIRLADLDRQNNTVSVRQKGGTFKLLPMGKRLREALDELIATRPQMKETEYLFANAKTGEPIANIRPALRKLCQKAGVVKHVTPHLFRHSIATHLMGAGMNARIVQGFMGHADIETTEFYTHVAAKHLMGAANMVDEMLMNRGLSTQTPRRQKARQRGRS
jgi:site-specific recombinase XerD